MEATAIYRIKTFSGDGWRDEAARYSDANEAIADARRRANGQHTRVVSDANEDTGEREHVIYDTVRDQE
ncbi:MAG: hypothetical protein A2W31_11475 [Planctomycetes bacterium RBG_16_64_10]|nr:MAG: hypothetical protein A2W31_11475 [Planctomycetes bacterium RBG_16_64_10]